MFDARNYQVSASLKKISLGHSLDGQVISFGAGGGEDNLIAPGADEPGHLVSLLLHDRFDFRSKVVHRRGIAEPFGKERQQGFQNFGAHRRGRSVIHIGSFHDFSSDSFLM